MQENSIIQLCCGRSIKFWVTESICPDLSPYSQSQDRRLAMKQLLTGRKFWVV